MRLADARVDAAVERGAPPRERADAAVGLVPPGLALELLLLRQGRATVLADHRRHREDTVDGEAWPLLPCRVLQSTQGNTTPCNGFKAALGYSATSKDLQYAHHTPAIVVLCTERCRTPKRWTDARINGTQTQRMLSNNSFSDRCLDEVYLFFFSSDATFGSCVEQSGAFKIGPGGLSSSHVEYG